MTRKTIKSGPDELLTDAELRRLVVAISGENGGQILAKLGTHRIVGRLLSDLTAARAELAELRARPTLTPEQAGLARDWGVYLRQDFYGPSTPEEDAALDALRSIAEGAGS